MLESKLQTAVTRPVDYNDGDYTLSGCPVICCTLLLYTLLSAMHRAGVILDASTTEYYVRGDCDILLKLDYGK